MKEMEEKYAQYIFFHCRENMETYIIAGALQFRDVLFAYTTQPGIVTILHESDEEGSLASAIANQAANDFLSSEPKEPRVTPYPTRVGDK